MGNRAALLLHPRFAQRGERLLCRTARSCTGEAERAPVLHGVVQKTCKKTKWFFEEPKKAKTKTKTKIKIKAKIKTKAKTKTKMTTYGRRRRRRRRGRVCLRPSHIMKRGYFLQKGGRIWGRRGRTPGRPAMPLR